jgi:hypothetical protein
LLHTSETFNTHSPQLNQNITQPENNPTDIDAETKLLPNETDATSFDNLTSA